jgi:hypothetical protein
VPDTAPLISAVQPVADRLRTLPESALRRGAAAEGRALARELAVRAQRLEFPGQPPRELPEAGVFAVGDQLLVVVHDLAEVLRGLDADAPDDAARELAEAVELLRSGAERIADAAAGTTGTR